MKNVVIVIQCCLFGSCCNQDVNGGTNLCYVQVCQSPRRLTLPEGVNLDTLVGLLLLATLLRLLVLGLLVGTLGGLGLGTLLTLLATLLGALQVVKVLTVLGRLGLGLLALLLGALLLGLLGALVLLDLAGGLGGLLALLGVGVHDG